MTDPCDICGNESIAEWKFNTDSVSIDGDFCGDCLGHINQLINRSRGDSE